MMNYEVKVSIIFLLGALWACGVLAAIQAVSLNFFSA